MRRLGFGADRIAKARAAYEKPIEVHPENWTAVQVFRLCTLPMLMGFAGAALTQVSVLEIDKAAEAYGVPLTPLLIHAVRTVAGEYCRIKNAANATPRSTRH